MIRHSGSAEVRGILKPQQPELNEEVEHNRLIIKLFLQNLTTQITCCSGLFFNKRNSSSLE
jgi:hypothetical protein